MTVVCGNYGPVLMMMNELRFTVIDFLALKNVKNDGNNVKVVLDPFQATTWFAKQSASSTSEDI